MSRFEKNHPQRQTQASARHSYTRDLLEIAVSGATGLAAGAALMYLFDPQTGRERRQWATDAAGSAIEGATDAISSAASGVGEYVSDLRDRYTHNVSDTANDYSSRIGSTWQAAKDTAGGWADRARSQYRGAAKSARRYAKSARPHWGEEGFSTPTLTISAFGALALGCAAMYFLDSRLGQSRRAYIGQKATRLLNDVGDLARATGVHLANRAKGYYSETRGLMSSEQANDRTLEQRVRSALGRAGSIGDLDVSVFSGIVYLRGQCDPNLIADLTSAASAVRGVQEVRNETTSATSESGARQTTWSNPTAM